MSSRKSDPKMTCPQCHGLGSSAKTAQTCAQCGGSGQVSNEFGFPFHYPFNLTVFNPNAKGATANGGAAELVVPGSPGNPNQQGTNPVNLQLPTDAAYKWLFNLIFSTAPNVVGDASMWIQLFLKDLSAQGWPFQSAPIFGNLFAGNGQLPFVILEPLTFTKGTQLTLQGYPIQYSGLVTSLGPPANAAALVFTGVLPFPVLPGSVVVTDLPGVVVGTDDGNGNITGGAGAILGNVNYINGVITVTYAGAPAAGSQPTATSSQGCARVDSQMDFWGEYLRPFSDAEVAAISSQSKAA